MIIRATGSSSFRNALLSACAAASFCAAPAFAQGAPNLVTSNGTPAALPNHATDLIAQSAPPAPPATTDLQPIDLTPVNLPERGGAFSTLQNLRTGVLYYLPAKMFMNVTVENSGRLETNVFLTQHHQRQDLIYRVLPNVNVGYAFNPTTRVSANYFMFRDTYGWHGHSLSRTIHSVGVRGDKDFYLNPRTVLTASLAGRELFITRSEELSDILPSITLVRRVGNGGAVYASSLGQIRFQDLLDKFQEGDIFHSLGYIYRTQRWTYTADSTFIDNFGKGHLRGGPNTNHMVVLTFEAGRRLSSRVPITAFVRAEPIFNIGQEKRPGYAGFNFRLFGGIRTEISKPAIFPVKLRGA